MARGSGLYRGVMDVPVDFLEEPPPLQNVGFCPPRFYLLLHARLAEVLSHFPGPFDLDAFELKADVWCPEHWAYFFDLDGRRFDLYFDTARAQSFTAPGPSAGAPVPN